MTATETPIAAAALAHHLIEQLAAGSRVLVVLDRDVATLQWREEFEQAVLAQLVHPRPRLIRFSTGYHRLELAGEPGFVAIVTARSAANGAANGAARGLVLDQLVLPAEADADLRASLIPAIIASGGDVVLHSLDA